MSIEEVQKALGVGRGTIYRLMDNDPDFRTLKIGGRRMVRREALEEYIQLREKREMEARGAA